MLDGHTNWVLSIAFSSDGNRAVSCSADRSMRVWDLSASLPYICERSQLGPTAWLLSPSGEGRLMFVPLDAQLPTECNVLTISRSTDSSVDFTNASLGRRWHECYQS